MARISWRRLRKGLRGVPGRILHGYPLAFNPDKRELLDRAFRDLPAGQRSFADLGGVWGIGAAYTFYLMDKFGVSVQASQVYLFVFLFAVAAGTIIGGPVGDRIGRKRVIWISILGVAPFSLALPHLGLAGTVGLSVLIGLILASAFSAILVYAQELVPGNVGLIAGLFFGLAFGAAGLGSALLGRLADHTSIGTVFTVSAYFPLIGLLTAFLPEVEQRRPKA